MCCVNGGRIGVYTYVGVFLVCVQGGRIGAVVYVWMLVCVGMFLRVCGCD